MPVLSKVFTRLTPRTSALFLCDMQEKFRNTVSYFPQVVEVSNRLLQAAKLLDMTIVATEQYPKGLGKTVDELGLQNSGIPIFEKTCFSMVVQNVQEHLNKTAPGINSIILCGIETHACVFQTALDFLNKEYDVHVVVDASSSRNMVDRMFAFRQLERAGAMLTTCECILLALLRDSSHPKFKEIQKLIMQPSPDSGLLHKL